MSNNFVIAPNANFVIVSTAIFIIVSVVVSVTAAGYASLDLSAIPQVRPGLLLKIVEVPEREAPIGKPGVDVLMPPGGQAGQHARVASHLGPP